jgi:hypothetical protein
MRFALDESLDDGSWEAHVKGEKGGAGSYQLSSGSTSSSTGLGGIVEGLAAVVVKPACVGGVEAAMVMAAAAGRRGVQVRREWRLGWGDEDSCMYVYMCVCLSCTGAYTGEGDIEVWVWCEQL